MTGVGVGMNVVDDRRAGSSGALDRGVEVCDLEPEQDAVAERLIGIRQ